MIAALARAGAPTPPHGVVAELFETMYFASLHSEEAEPIIFHVVYVDPSDPDPTPPPRIRSDRWQYVGLAERLRLDIPTIVKLAKATDPRTSSIAVYPDSKQRLYAHGLVDQGNRYHDFVHYESESGPQRPGTFQASIAGLGHIVVYDQYDTIGELKVDRLLPLPVDALGAGPILAALRPGIDEHVNAVRTAVGDEIFDENVSWPESLSEAWRAALCRILLRVQRYRHGGALLITDNEGHGGLDPKYMLPYERLRTALVAQSIASIQRWSAQQQIFDAMEAKEEEISMSLYLEEAVWSDEREDVRSEIEGALWFISLLTRVDGLVVMNHHLEVKAFGVEIIESREPDAIWIARSPSGIPSNRRKGNYHHFGTRHRSMMRYCSAAPGSVGFVVSQDGDVRAMTTIDSELVIWENLKLRLQDFARRRV